MLDNSSNAPAEIEKLVTCLL